MSDQTPDLENVPRIDGKNLINITGAGITSINGDGTPAQIIAAGSGITVTDVGNTHTIATTAVQAITTDDVVPNNGTILFFHALVEGAVSNAITTRQTLAPNEYAVDVRNFLSGHGGLVTDPGAAAVTDYLGADNTFRPLPTAPVPDVAGSAVLGAAINDLTWTNGATVLVPATAAHYQMNVRTRFHNAGSTHAGCRVTINAVVQDFFACCDASPGGGFPDLECAPCFAAITGALTVGDTITVQGFQNTGGPITFDSWIEIASIV